MVVYIAFDNDGFCVGYGSSPVSEDSIAFSSDLIPEDFKKQPFSYQLVDNELIFNDTKVKQDEQDREDFKNQPTREELLEAELIETQLALTEIYELLLGGV